jgi:hypothetical protein
MAGLPPTPRTPIPAAAGSLSPQSGGANQPRPKITVALIAPPEPESWTAIIVTIVSTGLLFSVFLGGLIGSWSQTSAAYKAAQIIGLIVVLFVGWIAKRQFFDRTFGAAEHLLAWRALKRAPQSVPSEEFLSRWLTNIGCRQQRLAPLSNVQKEKYARRYGHGLPDILIDSSCREVVSTSHQVHPEQMWRVERFANNRDALHVAIVMVVLPALLVVLAILLKPHMPRSVVPSALLTAAFASFVLVPPIALTFLNRRLGWLLVSGGSIQLHKRNKKLSKSTLRYEIPLDEVMWCFAHVYQPNMALTDKSGARLVVLVTPSHRTPPMRVDPSDVSGFFCAICQAYQQHTISRKPR